MKLNRKLFSTLLVLALALTTLLPASATASAFNATYSEASYYEIATAAYSRMLQFDGGVVIAANKNRQYGLVDAMGNEVMKFQHAGMWALGGGLYKVSDAPEGRTRDNNAKEGIINAAGVFVLPMQEARITKSSTGILEVSDEISDSKYYDLTMQPSTSDAYWGNEKDHDYDFLQATNGGYQSAHKNDQTALLDANGKVVFALGEYERISVFGMDGYCLFAVEKNGTAALLAADKSVIVPAGTYTAFQNDWEGSQVITVLKDDLFGTIDPTGKVLVPLDNYYGVGGQNQKGYISAVKKDDAGNFTSYLYDSNGKLTKTYNKEVATENYYRELVFTLDGKHGMMNLDESIIVPAQYVLIGSDGSDNLLTAVPLPNDDYNYLMGLMSVDGKTIFENKYSRMAHISENRYQVVENDLYGMLDATTGKAVIPVTHMDMRVLTKNFILLYDGTSHWMVDFNNTTIVPKSAELIEIYDSIADMGSELMNVEYLAYSRDNYEGKVLPVLSKTSAGTTTTYVDYSTGKTYGSLPYAASNITSDGKFVYQGANGLYGFAQATGYSYSLAPYSFADTAKTAFATATAIRIDGKPVALEAYALKDANNNQTNYMKLRDIAHLLNGTGAQFNVGWDGTVTITTKTAYTANGSEMTTPYKGDRGFAPGTAVTKVDGVVATLESIVLTDAQGNGYTYYKLRDLGKALGFNVKWDGAAGAILLETGKPYTG